MKLAVLLKYSIIIIENGNLFPRLREYKNCYIFNHVLRMEGIVGTQSLILIFKKINFPLPLLSLGKIFL